VEPAIEEARRGGRHPTFNLLRKEIEELTREPTGVGLDLPAWLVALEEEVEQAFMPPHELDDTGLASIIPTEALSPQEVERQLDEWSSRQ
jgi:hypothetical protein